MSSDMWISRRRMPNRRVGITVSCYGRHRMPHGTHTEWTRFACARAYSTRKFRAVPSLKMRHGKLTKSIRCRHTPKFRRKLNTVNMRNKHGITVHDQKTKIPCNSVIENETRKTHGINTMSPCTRRTRKFRVVPWYKIKHGKHTEQTPYCRARSVHENSMKFRHRKLNTENTRNQHGVGVRNSQLHVVHGNIYRDFPVRVT